MVMALTIRFTTKAIALPLANSAALLLVAFLLFLMARATQLRAQPQSDDLRVRLVAYPQCPVELGIWRVRILAHRDQHVAQEIIGCFMPFRRADSEAINRKR